LPDPSGPMPIVELMYARGKEHMADWIEYENDGKRKNGKHNMEI
jgi:hypothetical protein